MGMIDSFPRLATAFREKGTDRKFSACEAPRPATSNGRRRDLQQLSVSAELRTPNLSHDRARHGSDSTGVVSATIEEAQCWGRLSVWYPRKAFESKAEQARVTASTATKFASAEAVPASAAAASMRVLTQLAVASLCTGKCA